eukprot:2645038-Amphidinium_carterae.1
MSPCKFYRSLLDDAVQEERKARVFNSYICATQSLRRQYRHSQTRATVRFTAEEILGELRQLSGFVIAEALAQGIQNNFRVAKLYSRWSSNVSAGHVREDEVQVQGIVVKVDTHRVYVRIGL